MFIWVPFLPQRPNVSYETSITATQAFCYGDQCDMMAWLFAQYICHLQRLNLAQKH